MGEIKCLTPWDCQGKRLYMKDGIYPTLYAASDSGQQTHGICYAIKGNTVDRASNKNGKGWCEDVSPTLNTQDKHAVCFVYDARGNGDGVVTPTITGDHNGRITDYTSVVVIDHSRRHSYQPLDVFPTMEAHMGTGGGNVPLVMFEKDEKEEHMVVNSSGG